MKKEIKDKINRLANVFYQQQGYKVSKDYDFSKATHPQEISLWNQALVAYMILMDDFTISEYQL